MNEPNCKPWLFRRDWFSLEEDHPVKNFILNQVKPITWQAEFPVGDKTLRLIQSVAHHANGRQITFVTTNFGNLFLDSKYLNDLVPQVAKESARYYTYVTEKYFLNHWYWKQGIGVLRCSSKPSDIETNYRNRVVNSRFYSYFRHVLRRAPPRVCYSRNEGKKLSTCVSRTESLGLGPAETGSEIDEDF